MRIFPYPSSPSLPLLASLLISLLIASHCPYSQGSPNDAPRASRKGTEVSVTTAQLGFVYESQDGEITYPCEHEWLENAQEWSVVCAPVDKHNTAVRFTVHLRLFVHRHAKAPKLSYELLNWVTDHQQLPGGHGGKYVGSTVWFHLDEPSRLTALEVSQDIADTFTLKTKLVNLPY